MSQSKRFELCVYLEPESASAGKPVENRSPSLQLPLALDPPGSPKVRPEDIRSAFKIVGGMLYEMRNLRGASQKLTPSVILTRTGARVRYTTRVRAFDERSYYLCRVLVKLRAFGFINQKHFVFLDLTTGEEHELKSETVKTWCHATAKEVGSCYRFRETIYLTRDETDFPSEADRAAEETKA